MAQFYPKPGEVDVIVADMGQGIRASLGGNMQSDLEAIKEAIRPYISGIRNNPGVYTSTIMSGNEGLGLFITSEIAAPSRGFFTLGSGDAMIRIRGQANGEGKLFTWPAENEGWPGTLAMLQLRRDHIGDFKSLLENCKQKAEKARTNPRGLLPNFIENIPAGENIHVHPSQRF